MWLSKIRQNAFPDGASPRTPLRELTMVGVTPSRLGRGHPSPYPHHTRRLDSPSFDARYRRFLRKATLNKKPPQIKTTNYTVQNRN